jgi:hypothetical protein
MGVPQPRHNCHTYVAWAVKQYVSTNVWLGLLEAGVYSQ